MKLSKISQICKRHPHLRVFGTEQAQWVSIGAAAYPMYGMPTISEEAELLSVIDVPEEKRGPYEVQFIPPDNPLAFEDSADGEEMLRTVRYSFMQYGSVMMPLYTPDGRAYWINECYLAPAEDEKDLTFWLREIWPGMYAVAVKSGFEIVALIGVKIATSETEESLHEILGGIQMADRKGYRIPLEMVEQYRGYQLRSRDSRSGRSRNGKTKENRKGSCEMSEQDLMRVIREIYASLDGEAAKEMHEANMCITSRHVDKDGADEHKQKYHGWRRAAARVQHICFAHGIDPKSDDQDD